MEIGLFQLENLILSRARFCFLDLRRDPGAQLPPALQTLVKDATAVEPKAVAGHLQSLKSGKQFPIILMCETGATSSRVAAELERDGYSNIYVVEGGTEGLAAAGDF